MLPHAWGKGVWERNSATFLQKHEINLIRHLNSKKHKKCIQLSKQYETRKEKLLKWKKTVIKIVLVLLILLYTFQNQEKVMITMWQMFVVVKELLGLRITVVGFLTFFYDVYVIKSDIKNFLTSNNLPLGTMTDKTRTRHLTRHMVGIFIPILDVRSRYCNKDTYVLWSPTNDVTVLGVTNYFLETLEAFELVQLYLQQNLSGCAMDGQYIHGNVADHLKSIILKHFHVTYLEQGKVQCLKYSEISYSGKYIWSFLNTRDIQVHKVCWSLLLCNKIIWIKPCIYCFLH